MAELNTVWQAASEEMYKGAQQQQGQQQSQQTTDNSQAKADQEVTDVDFEEVK